MATRKDPDAKPRAKKAPSSKPPSEALKPSATAPVSVDAAEPAPDGSCALGRIIVFRLESQRYALPIEVVQEIQQIVAFSDLPDSSPAVVGVINLRGQVVPAVDLRLLVGLPAIAYGLQTPMVFVRTSRGVVSLIVDEVEDVVEVPAGSTQAPSKMSALADRLLCVVRLDTDLIFVFDIDRLVPPEAASAGRG
jgi:purine-binding chemotaxis protein CheW